MLNISQNDLITQTGPGRPAGELLRRYWQPAALVEQLDGPRPVIPVTLLGEDLTLYRREDGGYGLVGRHCPHRGSDLCYGRLEDGGLRCPFHGWLFDETGACLEQPGEPEGSAFHQKIKHTAYPCKARNGIVFAYTGPGEPPALPQFDCFAAPDSHCFAFKGYIDSNWLQALEVGIDPVHASFLHRFLEDEDPDDAYGKQFRDTSAGSDIPMTRILREYPVPKIEVEETDYGLRLMSLRPLNDQSTHIRVTNLAFPNAIVIPMSEDMIITQWHVPIDDERSWWYSIFSAYATPVDKKAMRAQRLELYSVPDYVPKFNRSNNWGYDPAEQKDKTYTGMGLDINVHDNWAVESPGRIQDRTNEHLGTTDKAITAYRRMLVKSIKAVEDGEAPPRPKANGMPAGAYGPVAVDTIGPLSEWQQRWREVDQARRAGSPWAAAGETV